MEYRFCPSCGGALEKRSLKASEPDRLVCGACGFIFYLDPKVAVGTIIADEDSRLVLVRRAIEPGYGLWVFRAGSWIAARNFRRRRFERRARSQASTFASIGS